MPSAIGNLLIVDDDAALRTSLSAILATFGHHVRSATDGFSALAELRQEIPDVIVSDLNMPGMSGFEFLSVVRRRFPAIHVIAMSSMGVAGGVPLGVAADAFYQKGSSLGSLLQIVEAMTSTEQQQTSRAPTSTPASIWVEQNGEPSSRAYVVLTCGVPADFPTNLRDCTIPSARNMLHLLQQSVSLRDRPTCCSSVSESTTLEANSTAGTA